MRRASVAVALASALLLAGCGGGGGSKSAKTTTSTTATGAGPGDLATSTTVAGSAGAAARTTTTAARPQTAGATTTTTGLAITAELAQSCVRAGGSQSITIHTAPMSSVGYDAVYSDGKTGMSPGYYGGNKSGNTDGTGTWSDTWVIAPNAPAGPVRVDVIGANASGASGNTTVSFAIAGPKGTC
jgi:hypothetical protein